MDNNIEEQQVIPLAQINKNNTNVFGISNGDIGSSNKLLLVDFSVDPLKYSRVSNQSGAKFTKVREDVVTDLKQIKYYLNRFEIPFSCNSFNVSIDNQHISDLARVGLEIHLNPYGGLTSNSKIGKSDYYIGPDMDQPFGYNHKLKVYGYATRMFEYLDLKYPPVKQATSVYDIFDTFGKSAPQITKIFKPLIDITKIFEDYGWIQKSPEQQFFEKSDNLKSNWFVFYKPHKINIGSTYKEILSSVYDNNNSGIWNLPDRVWDGEKFK